MKTFNSVSTVEARQVFRYLMRRAATDMTFRSGLLSNPRETLRTEFDLDLPEDFNVRFVENRGADLTVVLPDPGGEVSLGDDARADDDLDQVAGGGAWFVRELAARALGGPYGPHA